MNIVMSLKCYLSSCDLKSISIGKVLLNALNNTILYYIKTRLNTLEEIRKGCFTQCPRCSGRSSLTRMKTHLSSGDI